MVTKICNKCFKYYTTFDINAKLCDSCQIKLNPYSLNYPKPLNNFISQKPFTKPVAEEKPIVKLSTNSKPIIREIQRKKEEQERQRVESLFQQADFQRKDYRIIFRCEEELFNILNQYQDKSELIRRALRHYIKKHLNKNEQ